jgi:Spy/CpxP family protein refolding chaperone
MNMRLLATLALLVTLALAGPSEGQSTSGRSFGGPFGLNWRSSFHPTSPDLPRNLAALASHAKVREELKLTPEQITSLKEFVNEPRARQSDSLPQDSNSLPAEERARLAEERKARQEALSKEARQKVEAVYAILSPEQKARFKQILLQVRGIEVLDDLEVIEELALTEGQVRRFARIADEFRARYTPVFFQARPAVGLDRERAARLQELRDDMRDQMLALLTPEQRAKLEAMQGAKIEIDVSRLISNARFGRPERPSQPKD